MPTFARLYRDSRRILSAAEKGLFTAVLTVWLCAPYSLEAADLRVEVQMSWPGASVEEVEMAIARKLEEATKSLGQLVETRTRVTPGLCTLQLTFERVRRPKVPMREIAAMLDQIPSFPSAAEDPTIRQLTGHESILLAWKPDDGKTRLSRVTMGNLRSRIIRLPFIEQVRPRGWRGTQVLVELDNAGLKRFGLDESTVAQTISGWNRMRAEVSNTRRALEETAEQLQSVAIRGSKKQYKLSQFSTIRLESKTPWPVESQGQVVSTWSIRVRPKAFSSDAVRKRWHERFNEQIQEFSTSLKQEGKFEELFANSPPDYRLRLSLPSRISQDKLTEVITQAKNKLAAALRGKKHVLTVEKQGAQWLVDVAKEDSDFPTQAHRALTELPGVGVRVTKLDGSQSLVIRLSGPELQQLADWSTKLAREFMQTPGVCGIHRRGAANETEVQIQLKAENARRLSVPLRGLASKLRPYLQDSPPPVPGLIPIAVRLKKEVPLRTRLAEAEIALPDGRSVALTELADVKLISSPKEIIRIQSQRVVEVHVDFVDEKTKQKWQRAWMQSLPVAKPGNGYSAAVTKADQIAAD